jgi:amino acid transporter
MPGSEQRAAATARRPPARLARGVLGQVDIASATLANIAPAMSFFFGFATLVATAGTAAPLTVIAAAIAIALLGNTISQFSRSRPSTGSFVTFIGSAFGGYSAVATAVVLSVGYIIAIASVIAISGGWTHDILAKYVKVDIPWQALTAILVLIALYLVISGAKPSTKVAATFFAFELVLLIAIAVALLARHAAHINATPFDPSNLHRGFSGLSLGFPLAVYLFVGWENSAAMAEEARDARRAVPRAVFVSIAVIALLYIFLSYATVVGYNDNGAQLSAAPVPMVDAAQRVAFALGVLAYIAGFTSIVSSLISAVNSQARIIFNSGREGLLPSAAGRVTERTRAPWVALLTFMVLGLGITYAFGWSTDPVVFFGESATMGTILIALTYLVANLALPVYWRRHHRRSLNPLVHLLLPLVGAAAIGYPLYELVKPGQPAPYDHYRWVALGVIVLAALYGAFAYRRDPRLGERVGSIVADAD